MLLLFRGAMLIWWLASASALPEHGAKLSDYPVPGVQPGYLCQCHHYDHVDGLLRDDQDKQSRLFNIYIWQPTEKMYWHFDHDIEFLIGPKKLRNDKLKGNHHRIKYHHNDDHHHPQDHDNDDHDHHHPQDHDRIIIMLILDRAPRSISSPTRKR